MKDKVIWEYNVCMADGTTEKRRGFAVTVRIGNVPFAVMYQPLDGRLVHFPTGKTLARIGPVKNFVTPEERAQQAIDDLLGKDLEPSRVAAIFRLFISKPVINFDPVEVNSL